MRHLLGIEHMSRDEIERVLETSEAMLEISQREIKRVPTLRGRTVINVFLESSTRTRVSFELAGKRLGADVMMGHDPHCESWIARYREPPVRNAKVNSGIANLVKRLGMEAPDVAAFYLTHNEQFYVKKRHPVSLLLVDAEGLRTQWKTGTKATALEARSAEQKDSIAEQYKRITGSKI